MTKEELNDPLSICKREFQRLIDEYKFKQIRYPKWGIKNVFRYGLSNGAVTIHIMIYESPATEDKDRYYSMISIQDNYDNSLDINDLILKSKKHKFNIFDKNKKLKSLEEQIVTAVQNLKIYAPDILNGDLTRFKRIAKKVNKIRAENSEKFRNRLENLKIE
jgi:hypothetical protein